MELDEFRKLLDDWLRAHSEELAPQHTGAVSLDEEIAQLNNVKRLAFEAGWNRYGWPERVGGFGGSSLLRAYLAEALTAQNLVEPGLYSMTEIPGAHHGGLRSPGARNHDGATAPEWRGDVVPGIFGAGDGKQPGVAHVPRNSDGRPVARQRPESVDEPGAVCTALRPTGEDRNAGVSTPGHHGVVR